MSVLWEGIEQILARVERPGRYIGTEWNSVHKEWDQVPVRMVFAFPDLYEVGMSNLGLQVLYGLVNQEADYLMERVFAPAADMERELRVAGLPLFSLESTRPLADFDVIGFTLQYEMSFTNIINMINLAGLPLRSRDRSGEMPLVIGGGPVALNPEPLADFFDLFVLGDAEELLPAILEVIARQKRDSQDGRPGKEQIIQELSRFEGVYVPAFYEPKYNAAGVFQGTFPCIPGAARRIKKRVISDLDKAFFPVAPVVPFGEVIHDRAMLEVMRGCTRGCRFCQAGMVYRPVRERSVATLCDQAAGLVASTGHDEIALTSLSTSDYSGINRLTAELLRAYGHGGVALSLPSTRVDAFSVDLARDIQQVRRSGLTFAPEAGTQRLRDVINKQVSEDDILGATEAAFGAGWTNIKLYFMIGLPTETMTDLDGIVQLAKKILAQGRSKGSKGKKKPAVTVSVSSFIPKPYTPFQWEPQDSRETLFEKQHYLKARLRGPGLAFRWHDVRLSFLEGIFSRGDRRLSFLLERAWELGCRMDSWDEHLRFDLWEQALTDCAIEAGDYVALRRDYVEPLPWDHLDVGVTKAFLRKEALQALEGGKTADCRHEKCPGCGICRRFKIELDVKEPHNSVLQG